MNVYIIVEGDRTELKVYPAWLAILAPHLKRVGHPGDLTDNNYYLFSGHGIPSIYNHICNAIEDINAINEEGKATVDYLIVCMDTEEGSRNDIVEEIERNLNERKISLLPTCRLEIFEHKVSMESWFLGNGKLLGQNIQSPTLRSYRDFYDIKRSNPEEMGNIDSEQFTTTAQFHHSYLKELFKENHMKYTKANPGDVCEQYYLAQLIERYNNSGHITTFGRWYDFVTRKL